MLAVEHGVAGHTRHAGAVGRRRTEPKLKVSLPECSQGLGVKLRLLRRPVEVDDADISGSWRQRHAARHVAGHVASDPRLHGAREHRAGGGGLLESSEE